MPTTFCFCPPLLRTFAHRALWAAAILALAAADKRLRVPVLLPYEPPLSAASAASRRSTVRGLIPFLSQMPDNSSQVSHESPSPGIVTRWLQEADSTPIWLKDGIRGGWGVSEVRAAFVTTSTASATSGGQPCWVPPTRWKLRVPCLVARSLAVEQRFVQSASHRKSDRRASSRVWICARRPIA